MKTNIIRMTCLAAMLLCCSASTFAQTDAVTGATTQVRKAVKKITPEEIAKHQTAHMTKALSLTAEQQTKVSEIVKKYAKEKPSKEMFAKKDAEIEAVLTTEQKAKYAELKKAVAAKRMQGMKRPHHKKAENKDTSK